MRKVLAIIIVISISNVSFANTGIDERAQTCSAFQEANFYELVNQRIENINSNIERKESEIEAAGSELNDARAVAISSNIIGGLSIASPLVIYGLGSALISGFVTGLSAASGASSTFSAGLGWGGGLFAAAAAPTAATAAVAIGSNVAADSQISDKGPMNPSVRSVPVVGQFQEVTPDSIRRGLRKAFLEYAKVQHDLSRGQQKVNEQEGAWYTFGWGEVNRHKAGLAYDIAMIEIYQSEKSFAESLKSELKEYCSVQLYATSNRDSSSQVEIQGSNAQSNQNGLFQ